MVESKILSRIAVIVSLFAAGFTGLQWHDNHNQIILSMKPSVDFDTEDDDDQPMGIAIENSGPGLAVIQSITYYVDRKPVKDCDEAMEYGKLDIDLISCLEFEPGDTIAVTQKYWLMSNKKQRKPNTKALDLFADFLDEHVAIKADFCSIHGECFSRCSTKDRC